MPVCEIPSEDELIPLHIVTKETAEYCGVCAVRRQCRPGRWRPFCFERRVAQYKCDLRARTVTKICIQIAVAHQRAELPTIPTGIVRRHKRAAQTRVAEPICGKSAIGRRYRERRANGDSDAGDVHALTNEIKRPQSTHDGCPIRFELGRTLSPRPRGGSRCPILTSLCSGVA